MKIDFGLLITTVLASSTIVGIIVFFVKKSFEKTFSYMLDKNLEKYKNELSLQKEKEILQIKNDMEIKLIKEQELYKSELVKSTQKDIFEFQEKVLIQNQKLKEEFAQQTEKELTVFKNDLLNKNEKQKLLVEKQFKVFSEFVENIYRIRNYFRNWIKKLKELENSKANKTMILKEFHLFLQASKDEDLDLHFTKYRLINDFKNFSDASYSYRFFIPNIVFSVIHNSRNSIDSMLIRTTSFEYKIKKSTNENLAQELLRYIEDTERGYEEIDYSYKEITKLLQEYFNIDLK